MRQAFIPCEDIDIQDHDERIAAEAPWAEYVVMVWGGYLAFESRDDYETWKNQI